MLRSEGEGEYFSDEFSDYLRARNSEKVLMQIYPSAEWGCRMKGRAHFKSCEAMLNERKMHDYFWAKAIATTVYIMK